MHDKELPSRVIVGVILIGILLAGAMLVYSLNDKSGIYTFEDCEEAGYPITRGLPEQCIYNGQTFVNREQ